MGNSFLSNLTNAHGNAEKLKQIADIAESTERGVYKRIDENRELLELIQSHSPDLLKTHPYVVNWLASQDHFLRQIAQATGAKNPLKSTSEGEGRIQFPRPWPKVNV